MDVTIRPAVADDAGFLEAMLAAAADWRTTTPRPAAEVLREPHFAHYVAGWPRTGDVGFVATQDTAPVGAAWWRYFAADDPGFGFVAADIPEVSIGLVGAARGRGIGARLLGALVDEAARRDVPALSLSVEVENPAVRLYERIGFVPQSLDAGGAWTMVRRRG